MITTEAMVAELAVGQHLGAVVRSDKRPFAPPRAR